MPRNRDIKLTVSAEDRAARVLAGVQGSLRGVDERVAAINGSFGRFLPLLGTAFGGATFTSFIKGTVDSVLRLKDLREAVGSTIEGISGLEDIGERTGTSFDAISTSLVKFNSALKDAERTKEIGATFKALGLEVEQLRKLDPAQAMLETAKALENFADDGDRARVVQELFGRSVKEVAPFLRELAEAGELNGTVTARQVDEADRFSKQLLAVQKNAQDYGRRIVADLLPALLAVSEAMLGNKDAAKDAGEGFALLRVPLETILVVGAYVVDTFKGIGREIGAVSAQIAALGRGDFAGFKAIGQALEEDNRKAEKELDALVKKILQVKDAAKDLNDEYSNEGRNRPKPSVGAPKVEKETKDKVTAFERLLAKLREQRALEEEELARGRKLTEVERLGLQLVLEIADAKNKLTAAEKAQATAELEGLLIRKKENDEREQMLKLIAESQAAAAKLSAQRLAELTGENQQRATQVRQLQEQTEEIGRNEDALFALRLARLADAAAAERQTLVTLENAGAADEELAVRRQNLVLLEREIELYGQAEARRRAAAADAGAGAQRAVEAYLRDVEDAATATERFVSRSIDGLEDSITGLLTGQKDAFKSLVTQTIAEITRLYVVRPILADIFKGAQGGGGSQSFGWLGSLLSLFGGSSFSAYDTSGYGITSGQTGLADLGLGGGRAMGGSVKRGWLYPVNESGSELLTMGGRDYLMAGADGVVTPAGRTAAALGGGSSVSVVQHINIGAGVSPSQLAQALAQAREQAKAEIRDEIRRGSRAYA